ncbi:MAG: VanZ family protein [Culicoidibacterales bacterium]
MTNTKKQWLSILGAGLLVLAWIGFIFSQSLQTGVQSSATSGEIVRLLSQLAPNITGWFTTSQVQFFIRKLAHFSEYAILGLWLWLFWLKVTQVIVTKLTRPTYQAQPKQRRYSLRECRTLMWLTVMFSALVIAVMDETLQTFIPNRSGVLMDVWIDFSGLIIMLSFIAIIWYQINKRKTVGK